jgi:hypothetical protein
LKTAQGAERSRPIGSKGNEVAPTLIFSVGVSLTGIELTLPARRRRVIAHHVQMIRSFRALGPTGEGGRLLAIGSIAQTAPRQFNILRTDEVSVDELAGEGAKRSEHQTQDKDEAFRHLRSSPSESAFDNPY